MANVRQANLSDIPQMVALGELMHQESPRYRMMDYSADKCAELGRSLIAQGGLFVAEIDGVLVGMMAGCITEHFFGYDLMACDLVCYVLPEHRGSTTAVRLIKKFEAWAFDHGAKVISLGVSTEVNSERTLALYERLGYRKAGGILVKAKG